MSWIKNLVRRAVREELSGIAMAKEARMAEEVAFEAAVDATAAAKEAEGLMKDLDAASLSIAAAIAVAEVELKAAENIGGVLLESNRMECGSERVREAHVHSCKMQGCFAELQNINVGGVDAVGQANDFSNVRFDLAEMLKRGYNSVEVLFVHADEPTEGAT